MVFHVSSRKSTAGRQCVDRTIARCTYGCWMDGWLVGILRSRTSISASVGKGRKRYRRGERQRHLKSCGRLSLTLSLCSSSAAAAGLLCYFSSSPLPAAALFAPLSLHSLARSRSIARDRSAGQLVSSPPPSLLPLGHALSCVLLRVEAPCHCASTRASQPRHNRNQIRHRHHHRPHHSLPASSCRIVALEQPWVTRAPS